MLACRILQQPLKGSAWHFLNKRGPFDTMANCQLRLLFLNCMKADVHTSRAIGTAVPKSGKDKASSVVVMVILPFAHVMYKKLQRQL